MAADLIQAALLYRRQPQRNFPVPEGDASIGYDAGNQVRVPFEGVSRRHARITFDGKDYWIEDARSANGTFLNGNRLTRKERLRHLDIVTLGRRTDLIFVRKTMDSSRVKRRGIAAAYLETLDGPETGRRDEIPKGTITIGRSPSNNVVAESQLISKIHARLERSGVQLVLLDLQSANGTYVEGKRVTSHVLRDGEVFNLGHGRSYRVRLDEGDVFTHDIAMAATRDVSVAELPIDWKTRIEWTPEEKAVFDRAAASRKSRTFAQLPAQPTAASRPSKAVPAKAAPPPARPAPKSKPAEAKAASPTPPKPMLPAARPEPPSPSAPAKPLPQTAARAPAGAEPVAGKPQPPATPPPPRAEPKAPAPPPPIPAVPPQAASAPTPTPRSAAETKRPAPAAPITAPAPPSPATPSAAAPQTKAPTAAPAASVAKESGPPPAVAPPLPQAPVPQSVLSILPVDQQLTRPLEAKPAALARVVLEGASARFSLAPGDHEIGRVPGMSVQIEASGISRRHALLRVTDREATLEDLGSKNGSYVNGERIAAPRRLVNGDQLAFGEVKLRVRLETSGP